MREHEWSDRVVDTAHTFGWTVAHFGAARTQRGWRTPVRYDGAGFPDLVLVHPERHHVLFRELKVGRGKPSEHQSVWLVRLQHAGADVDVWHPDDWPRILATLSAGAARVA